MTHETMSSVEFESEAQVPQAVQDQFEVHIKLPNEVFLNRPEDQGNSKPVVERALRLEIDPETGFYTVFDGQPYLHGYPKRSHIYATNIVKSALLGILRVLSIAPYLIPFVYLARKPITVCFARFISTVMHVNNEKEIYRKPNFYMVSSQELYRVGMINPIYDKETHFNLVMGAVEMWESDSEYRYRGQYAFSKLNKANLVKDPRLELQRLCAILIQGEQVDDMKKKWQTIAKILAWLPLKKLTKIILELDLTKLEMDDLDIYWSRKKTAFNYYA
jgi:hypothetical protein